jgi:hypothetical protein
MKRITVTLLLVMLAARAGAAGPADFLKEFEVQARKDSAAFSSFSAERGAQFFKSKHGGEWSCASCHTDDPAAPGRHVKTDKPIKPMAPAVNPNRFTDTAKVEKWFKRNCGDVLDRPCSAQEKGDFITYLLSVKK